MTILSPSNSMLEAVSFFSSSSTAGSKRSSGSATSEYSSVSAMRPARSCIFTSWYLSFTVWRSISFGGAKRSRITLNTYGNEGSVKTSITMPLMPGRDDEIVRGMLQVVEEVPVEQGLALLGEAHGHVHLGARLLRHELAQERDVGGRHLHVDEEVGARKGEKHDQLVRVQQQGVQVRARRARCCRIGTANGTSRLPLTILPTA